MQCEEIVKPKISKASQYCKNYRKKYPEKVKEYRKQYYEENRERINKERRDKREKYKDKKREYYLKNIDKMKIYYEANREKKLEYLKEYRIKNKDRLNSYYVNRRKSDPLFKLECYMRNRIHFFLKIKEYRKNKRTKELVGISSEDLKVYIGSKFTENMSWENYGQWHIDHIIPLASAKTEEELEKLFHYTNLQPLWGIDNIKKGCKILK